MTFTRSQIESIEIGTPLVFKNGDRRSAPRRVVEILCRREDIHGRLFVHGYTEFGENSWISFGLKEGDETDARFYEIA